jgi:RNA polymerase sigma factor (sigma-70 family)
MIATRRESRPSQAPAAETDHDLVEAVRDGDDSAFEELYRRYHGRIAAYVRRTVRDPARAEDLAQDAFFSALRRMRATDAKIAFKPWIFEIARNATIDHWRRTSRAEEISVEADELLRPSDRGRLVGSTGPDSALVDKERLEHLRGAFDELSDVHTRILVMRELEGLSYREIATKLDLSRASVESALFRARRRLESEYADISEGRRCTAMRTVMARLAEGLRDDRDESRLARHARRCHVCRRRARELGVEPLAPLSGLRQKAAALLPIPFFTRRGGDAAHGGLSSLLPAGTQVSAAVAERAAAIVAAAALAGAGGAALSGGDAPAVDRDGQRPAVTEPRAPSGGAERSAQGTGASGRSDGASTQDVPDARNDARAFGEADGAGQEDSPGADENAATDGAEGTTEPGEVGVPQLPQVPSGVEGEAQRGASGNGLQVPSSPDPPALEAPTVPLSAPSTEAPRAEPVAPPSLPDLPAEAPAQLDDITAIAAG